MLVDRLTAAVAAIRRPEYTGERRCWACAVVNLVMVAAGSLAVFLAGWPMVAGATAAAGVAVVWARGYLVPGTPRFAPALVDRLPLPGDPFHTSERPVAGGLAGTPRGDDLGEAVMSSLVEAEVLVPDGEMLYVSEDFETRWHEEMASIRDRPLSELAAAIRETTPAGTNVTQIPHDERHLLVREADGLEGGLLARSVAVAEVAAVRALEPEIEDEATRLRAARPLRMFLETCPDCGTALGESTVRACCGGGTDPRKAPPGREALVCPACDERLFIYPG